MIKTSRQLKALVRNKSEGDNSKALYIMRSYAMERFLERLSVSKYKNHMALKGGILIASLIGFDKRSTMDIDTTLIQLSLEEESVKRVVGEIISIEIGDGMSFNLKKSYQIMDESEYPGIRIELEAKLEKTSIPIKIDFSAGDKITPEEVEYRNSQQVLEDAALIVNEIGESAKMEKLWQEYQEKFDYASDLEWKEIVKSVKNLVESMFAK